MTRNACLGAIFAAVGVMVGVAWATKPSLPRKQELPLAARTLLHQRMVAHGADADALFQAAIRLDHRGVTAASQRILAEPWLSKPRPAAPGELNAELPPRFFELQDALRATAKGVDQAATAEDDHALAGAVGRLTTVCVECHATYLPAPVPKASGPR